MILLQQINSTIKLEVKFQIYNTSKLSFDLEKLKLAIISQLARVYNITLAHYKMTIRSQGEIVKHQINLSSSKILIQITDTVQGNNAAEADLRGLRIKLNANAVNDIIIQTNIRTIPHEFGHLFGWNHPHANATFNSINSNADELEKHLSEPERCCNLMSQTWYIQKANTPINKALNITEPQIKLLIKNYNSDILNNNYHLNYFLFWKKLV